MLNLEKDAAIISKEMSNPLWVTHRDRFLIILGLERENLRMTSAVRAKKITLLLQKLRIDEVNPLA